MSRTRLAAVEHPVVLIETPGRGRGVVAARAIRRGEIVLTFGGPLLPLARLSDFTHCLEVAPGLFLGPSGMLDDYVNHSCDPNCAVEIGAGGVALRAIRRIAPGCEVTFDYSTVMVTDPTTFACSCGTARCRGTVRAFGTLPDPLREAYVRRGLVPGFVTGRGPFANAPSRKLGDDFGERPTKLAGGPTVTFPGRFEEVGRGRRRRTAKSVVDF